MKRYLTYTIVAGLSTMLLSSCFSDKRSPGWEYMPDMAHSTAYDAYSPNPNYKDGMTSRKPVAGTVPLYQGVIGHKSTHVPYPYPATNEGYDAAGRELKNPIPLNSGTLAEGERLFNIYCAVCHGVSGQGNGSIVVNPNIKNPFPPPPSYFSERLLTLPEGQMYHTIVHGRNLMGSYASQLNEDQRWQVIHHVKSMQQHYSDSLRGVMSTPVPMTGDTTKSASATSSTTNATPTTQSK